MARTANLTNDNAVRALKWSEGDPAQFAVKDKAHKGFYLRISKGGTKAWYFQYKMNGKLRRRWYGRYPKKPCAEAFGLYSDDREQVNAGVDVVAVDQEKVLAAVKMKQEDEFTLSVLFKDHYLPRYAKRTKRTWRNDEVYFETKIEPTFGTKPAKDLTPVDVEKLIRPLEEKGYNTARLVLAVLRKMYNWGANPVSAENPGDGPLLNVFNPCSLYKLDPANAPAPIDKILTNNELKQLWNRLGDTNADRILKLQILTGCRVTEVAGMQEEELDRDEREWNLPLTRTKSKRALSIPLTDRMESIICPKEDERDYIFSASSKLGHTTGSGVFQSLKRHCKKLKITGIGTHTMRRTFITNLARLEVRVEVRNRLTNHKDPTIDAVYNKHDYAKEKREALEKWDRKLDKLLKPQKHQ